MAINNYTLATKPYTRGFSDQTTTVVEIRLQDGSRYSTNQRELVGDRTQDKEDVLIQAVLDIVKAELDPGSAVVKTQQELVETKTKQDELQKLVKQQQETSTTLNKAIRILSLIVAKIGIPVGAAYKELASFMPPLVSGQTYFENDLLFLEDPNHVEANGEGKYVFVYIKREFEYNGQTVEQLKGQPTTDGLVEVLEWTAPRSDVDHI